MVNILHIETSSKNCSVSLGTDGKLNSLCEEISPDFKHSENLHTFIQWALEGAELGLEDIHAVSVGKGPGSYTGLRIGVASAKGFCFGNDIPLISVNSLYILACPYFNSEYDFIIPVMDARRMEVYTSVFTSEGNPVEETHAHILREFSFEKYRAKKVLFIGDAVEKIERLFMETSQNLQNISFSHSYPSAENMIPASYKKYQSHDFEDIAYFDPFYLKEWK
ncbi:MAG: tRNA (adenosine(37)-N6)-threonylcarbamoyltransferase complex dimerization subunit type 1 TsaB [Flavobacteriaceae bacterium]|jgi:tRNA threonylcarbamoyladenosine biosynthesis protein TsaB|nr:tRNA (adenosine(37)-N6)-threonylcarbamoyltransferase complex dimerization subunit type 1 TsaB [Flavobacteriaceae bacterium]